jgi:hypothetical protein
MVRDCPLTRGISLQMYDGSAMISTGDSYSLICLEVDMILGAELHSLDPLLCFTLKLLSETCRGISDLGLNSARHRLFTVKRTWNAVSQRPTTRTPNAILPESRLSDHFPITTCNQYHDDD